MRFGRFLLEAPLFYYVQKIAGYRIPELLPFILLTL